MKVTTAEGIVTVGSLLAWIDAQDPAGDGTISGGRSRAADPGPAGYTRCAVFDADGTLWEGDLTEAIAADVRRTGEVTDAGLETYNVFLSRYGEPPATSTLEAADRLDALYGSGRLHTVAAARGEDRERVDLEIWPSYNWLVAGWQPEALARRTEALIDAGFGERFRPELVALLAGLRARGFKVVVVSAGIEPVVRAAAARFGFAPEEVRGMRSKVVGGRLVAEIEPPVMYGEGKRAVARDFCRGAPLVAVGDSAAGSDRAMLADARVPVAVSPSGRHLEHAQVAHWPILPCVPRKK